MAVTAVEALAARRVDVPAHDMPPIHLAAMPIMAAFLDRVRDAGLAAGHAVGEEVIVPPRSDGPAPR